MTRSHGFRRAWLRTMAGWHVSNASRTRGGHLAACAGGPGAGGLKPSPTSLIIRWSMRASRPLEPIMPAFLFGQRGGLSPVPKPATESESEEPPLRRSCLPAEEADGEQERDH